MAEVFWQRWRKEYLTNLQNRVKWIAPRRNLREGDIVTMSCDDVLRYHWPLGRILKCYSDDDGIVRSADVRTASSTFKRPVSRLVVVVPNDD